MTEKLSLVELKQFEGQTKATTTSIAVAEYFERLHAHVIRDIESLISEKDRSKFGSISPTSELTAFFKAHFQKSSYQDDYGREQPMYIMDRDGWTLLVMGYQDPKAMTFKIKYIDCFNKMEATILDKIKATAKLEAETISRAKLLNDLCVDPLRVDANRKPVKKGGIVVDSTVAAFFLDCVDRQDGVVTNSTVLYQAYRKRCDTTGNIPVTHARFSRILTVLGIPKGRTAVARNYQGVKLKD